MLAQGTNQRRSDCIILSTAFVSLASAVFLLIGSLMKFTEVAMCTAKEKLLVHNFNRLIIVFLSALYLLWDGFQFHELFCVAAMVLWLWQPEWDEIQVSLIDKIRRT